MARPELPNAMKKVKLNLTVSRETKEMLDLIRIKKNISISAFLEEAVAKECRKLQKSGKITDLQVREKTNKIEPKIENLDEMQRNLETLMDLLERPDLPDENREIYEKNVHELKRSIAKNNVAKK